MSGQVGRKPLISVEDAAALLGVSRSSLYRAIQRGDIPVAVIQINGRYCIPRRSVERLIDGTTDHSPAA